MNRSLSLAFSLTLLIAVSAFTPQALAADQPHVIRAVRAGDAALLPLKSGDRVVFYGDSITEQRLYTSYVETFLVTRLPKLDLRFVHSGVGGDRVGGGWAGPIDLRLDRDVIAYKPTVMTVMLGMNDASYQPYKEETFSTYATGYRHLLEKTKSALPGIRFTLIEPSPFDDVTRAPGWEGGYNGVLARYGQYVKELASQQGASVADLNTPVVAMLTKAKEADATGAQKIIPDRVHPGDAGHLIMAEALLKAWNAPGQVASVEIDANGKKVVKAENAKVASLTQNGETLTWDETDGSLPFPLDDKNATLMLAVHSSDFVEALDQEPLKVTGLTAARYTLRIDGQEAGAFTKEQLAGGINLATLPTPMVKQAAEVHGLTWKHLELHQARWRNVQMPFDNDKSPALQRALSALDALEESTVKQQRAAAQPKPHRYELSPAS